MTHQEDLEMRHVGDHYITPFLEKVNALLKEGGWRVVHTEISEIDGIYSAYLVRNNKETVSKESLNERWADRWLT